MLTFDFIIKAFYICRKLHYSNIQLSQKGCIFGIPRYNIDHILTVHYPRQQTCTFCVSRSKIGHAQGVPCPRHVDFCALKLLFGGDFQEVQCLGVYVWCPLGSKQDTSSVFTSYVPRFKRGLIQCMCCPKHAYFDVYSLQIKAHFTVDTLQNQVQFLTNARFIK